MRWVATGSDEYAFLSIGGTAQGIIAIGGTAHGIVAIGGFLSVGVISIGMNAVGSVVALGMNAVAPISLSLINGLGLFAVAGVNGCGTYSTAGVNATGADAVGGTNSVATLWPTVAMLVVLIGASSVFRGKRPSRGDTPFPPLRRLLASGATSGIVEARLAAVADGSIDLAGRGAELAGVRAGDEVVAAARSLDAGGRPVVYAALERYEESVVDPSSTDYRTAPERRHDTRWRCTEIRPAPPRRSLLPQDAEELQWVNAWAARLAAAAAVVLLLILWAL